MTVGVCMPTYNQCGFIAAAVDSVKDQVDALVIVDDGSTDGTAEWLDEQFFAGGKFIVVHHEQNYGTAIAINTGIELLAKCDWLTWVSSDNVMAPDWIAELLAPTEHTDNVGAVYGGFTIVQPERNDNYVFYPYDPQRLIAHPNCYFGPAFIIRNDVWQPHRGKLSHDYDSWLRVEEACWDKGLDIVGVDRNLCTYIAHPDRATATHRGGYDAPYWQEEALKRRSG